MSIYSPQSGNLLPSPVRLKRRAKSLSATNPDLTNLSSLDLAARELGSSSYKGYLRTWELQRAGQRQDHEVILRAHWRDTRSALRGTETVRVTLSAPWEEFLTLTQRRAVFALNRFRIVNGNRQLLVSSSPFSSAMSALSYASKAAGLLAFADVTRLVPATYTMVLKGLGLEGTALNFPGSDHASLWQDLKTGLPIVLNEPYVDRLHAKAEAQQKWFLEHGITSLVVPDCSIHNPQGTVVQIITTSTGSNSQGFNALKRRLGSLKEGLAKIEIVENF